VAVSIGRPLDQALRRELPARRHCLDRIVGGGEESRRPGGKRLGEVIQAHKMQPKLADRICVLFIADAFKRATSFSFPAMSAPTSPQSMSCRIVSWRE